MKNRTKQLFITAIITSILSVGIGGFAVWSSYQGELAIVDGDLNQIESDIRNNPTDAVSIALLSVEQNNFDFTLAFETITGEITILRESIGTPITGENLRVRNIPIPEGDQLIVAASLSRTNANLKENLWKLLIFIIFTNIITSKTSSISEKQAN